MLIVRMSLLHSWISKLSTPVRRNEKYFYLKQAEV